MKNLLLSTRQSDRLLDVAAALQAALAGKGGTPALTPAEDTTEAARDLTVTIEPLDLSVTRDGHTFRVTYPQITVAGRDAVAGKINACFESERGMYEAAVLDPDTVSNMFAYTETSVTLYDDTSAEVVYQDENVLSIVFTNSMYHGGAHGIYGKRGFTFDLRTGELAGVTDLFNEPASEMLSTIRARIKATVREQTENRMSGEAADAYTLEQLNFWIDGNGELTVYIGVYEMASFADGDFEVPCGYTLSGGSPAAVPTTEAPTTEAPTTEAPSAPAVDATGDYTQPVRDFLRVLRQQNLESVYMLFSRYTREASPDGAVLLTLLLAIASESPELQNETAELRIVEERDFTDAEFSELLEDDPNGIYHLTAAKHLMVDVVVDGVPKNDPADFMVVKEDGEWKLLMVDLF